MLVSPVRPFRRRVSSSAAVRTCAAHGTFSRAPASSLRGTSRADASINFSLFIRDYLSWPLFVSDPENPPELARPAFRYTAAFGTVLISSLCGWYFWYSPSRMITRVTVYPRTKMVGLRTAAPSPALWLPRFLRQRPFFQRAGVASDKDPFERLVPLNEVYRLQGSALGSEVAACNRLVKERVDLPPHLRTMVNRVAPNISKVDLQDNLMLRVGDARLAFQLSAEPSRTLLLNEPPVSRGKRWWQAVFKGPADWAQPPNYAPSEAEAKAHEMRVARGLRAEPWFLDRANFDQLFPLDATRYSKK